MKARFIEIHLYDALEALLSELYADGPSCKTEMRASRCLSIFERKYGNRHDMEWEQKERNNT